MSMPSLSIVIPVFNQPEWIGRTIAEPRRSRSSALDSSGWSSWSWSPTVPTREALARIAARHCRCACSRRSARAAWPRASRASRRPPGTSCCCSTRASSIVPRCAALRRPTGSRDERDLPIWSAHFEFDVETPYGRFWSVIIPLVWWRCYSDPRTTSFGLGGLRSLREGDDLLSWLRVAMLLRGEDAQFELLLRGHARRQRRHRA